MQWPKKLVALYKLKLPISEAKNKDVVSLCQSGIIPEDCQDYYYSLPTKEGKKTEYQYQIQWTRIVTVNMMETLVMIKHSVYDTFVCV